MYLRYISIFIVGSLLTLSVAAPESRVVNGYMASTYQFPWHVSLTVTVANTDSPRYCGGSLISSHLILTAATCVVDALNIKADLGSILFAAPTHSQNTSLYIMYPQFNKSDSNLHNIALVRLHDEVPFDNNKRAIYLIGHSQQSNTFLGFETYVSGFGVYQNGVNYMSELLRFAKLGVISNEQCRLNFLPSYIRTETMCTMGYNNTLQSGCYGDVGGALVTNLGGTWYQIGLVSTIHGSGCTGTYPNLHTRIGSYIQWIYLMTGIPINP